MKSYEFLAEAEATKSYEIKPGDTLTKIASKNNTTIDAIMALNQGNRAIRDRDTIYAGGTIKLPKTSADRPDPGGMIKRQGSDTIASDPVAASNDNRSSDRTSPSTPHPVGTVVKPDWSTTPYRDLGPLVKKSDGYWYTLDGKNRATDEKVISMAERLSPMPQSSVVVPPNTVDTDKKSNLPPRSKAASNEKSTTRPGQLRDEKNDISPIPGAWVTDRFGSPRPGRTHQGIDLHADIGTPVLAPNNGKVLDVGYGATTGHYVTLGDMRGNKAHRFMHLSKSLVDQGDIVRQGQEIAKSGNSGFSERTNKAYPAHLHWEKFVNGEPVDPAKFISFPTKS